MILSETERQALHHKHVEMKNKGHTANDEGCMTFEEYRQSVLSTSVLQTSEQQRLYGILNIAGEAGEITSKYAKAVRDDLDITTDEFKKEVAKEIGDVLWSMAILAESLGYTLEQIAVMNAGKTASRSERGVVAGSGDNR